jgi:hypothetical protein
MVEQKTSWRCPVCKEDFYENVPFHICNGSVDRTTKLIPVFWFRKDENNPQISLKWLMDMLNKFKSTLHPGQVPTNSTHFYFEQGYGQAIYDIENTLNKFDCPLAPEDKKVKK